MIVVKSWERYTWCKVSGKATKQSYVDTYTGYFLFGIIPLFIRRGRKRC